MQVTARRLWLVVGLALLLHGASAQAREWKWVVGKLDDDKANREYRAFAKRVFDYYQGRRALVGELVEESEIDGSKRDHVVFLGPVEAFEFPQRFGLPLTLMGNGSIKLGDVTLNRRRVGLFLRNAAQTRFLYTGMTRRGFRDIFSVQTGWHGCTITENGKVKFEGDYANGKLSLRGAGGFSLAEFPSADRLKKLPDQRSQFSVGPAYEGDGLGLHPRFARRVDELTEKNNVLFVGESHWNVGANRLFNVLLAHVLRTRDVRAVFLEVNYSFSPFLDHYVTLDNAAAKKFLAEVLHPLVGARSVLALLETVRRHNLDGAKPRVRMAGLDLEWSPGAVNALLRQAERDRSKFPFLSDVFLANAKRNERDTQQLTDFHPQRQKAIIRNITEFHGDLLGPGLAVFKGGGFHAVKKRIAGEKFDRDAAYLHHTHPATKGRVATLWIDALGYSFAEVAELELRDRLPSATNYQKLVTSFQRGRKAGLARDDTFYLLSGELDPVRALVAKRSLELGVNAVWVERRPAEGAGARHRLQDYDASVVVLRSELERPRPRNYRDR